MVDLFRYKHWDFVGKRSLYFIISLILVIVSIAALFKNGLNLGIDFKGGGLVSYTVEGKINDSNQILEGVRAKLHESGDENLVQAHVQIASAGTNDQIIVNTRLIEEEGVDQNAIFEAQIKDYITPAVTAAAEEHGLNLNPIPDSKEVVSGTISNEFVTNAVIAIIVGMLLIMAWIWLRYNISGAGFRYSLAGIITLLQGVIITLGFFAVFHDQFQINSPFIAALLTVIGFSIHDTIIIFDRIRENIRLMKGKTFAETVNISILETLARSVNTVVSLLLPLVALLLFGGTTIMDFVVAMLAGVIIGAFSSIFVASQLLVSWAKPDQRVMTKDF